MSALNGLNRMLRGPLAVRLLTAIGIDAKRYWLLIDLFGELSDRGEVLDQLGTQGIALRGAMWLYGAYSALMTVVFLLLKPAVATYLSTFLGFTAFILFSILLSEAGNSLVHPAESLILAHQPINGATYTGAKLTHLARIIFYLVPGLNVVPAFAGLFLKQAPWYYPVLHLAAALSAGFLVGLLCCALYGWLIRFLPVRRLKAVGQFAGALPFFVFMMWQPVSRLAKNVKLRSSLTLPPAAQLGMALIFGAIAVAIVAIGIRSLSADYLIRVSQMMHGASRAKSQMRRSWIGDLVARLSGGQPARAGYAFVACMSRRDFQFIRQLAVSAFAALVGLVPLIVRDWRVDPFKPGFSMVHLLPHAFGFVLFFLCAFLPYGSDFKGSWCFQLVPSGALERLARGVHAALWTQLVAIPHALMLLVFAWPWGIRHAALFTCYSLTAASFYLSLELRLIDGVPFSKQLDPKRTAAELPILLMGGAGIAVAVGIQYYLLFRSEANVAIATVVAGLAAWYFTRQSLAAFAESMRYNLGLLSMESGTIYKEV